jgi:hypothetical protein
MLRVSYIVYFKTKSSTGLIAILLLGYKCDDMVRSRVNGKTVVHVASCVRSA